METPLQRALALLQRGQVREAEAALRDLVQRRPPPAEALHLLGICRFQQGDPNEALQFITASVATRPESVAGWCDHGLVLGALGRHEEALASYDRALARDPGFLNALFNRGVSLERLQRHAEAAACYANVVAAQPNHLGALVNLGNAFCALHRHADAVGCYDRALAFQPDLPVAWTNRGAALVALNRAAEALADHRRALAIQPDNALALNNEGIALAALGRHDEAIGSYDRALARDPRLIDALHNRANSLAPLKRYAEAANAYGQVLARDPGRKFALGDYLYASAHACEWRGYASLRARVTDAVRAGNACIAPFAFLNFSTQPADQRTCASICIADKHPAVAPAAFSGPPYRHDRIRIAYLSANFHDNPMAHLMAGLFERHDRARFEVWGISFGPRHPGPMRDRLESAFEHFVDVADASDDQVARRLRALEMDILVELMGFTEDTRLGIAARRAAPIQVSYMGYPGTLAASYIDYLIADRVVLPEDEAGFYSEKVVYMPDSYYVNYGKLATAPPAPSRRQAGLPADAFVFCCFNNTYKITPEVFDIWMGLLRRLPRSVLWLLASNGDAPGNLRREAQARGVDPSRLVFAPTTDRQNYLARYRIADLFLDTLPYNAHTTACDALSMGLPVLTCTGTTFAGRVGASLLQALELPELVTTRREEYEAKAFELASNTEVLAALRDNLARQRDRAPLFDTDRWRRHVEWAFSEMVLRHQRGEPPQTFAVPTLGTA